MFSFYFGSEPNACEIGVFHRLAEAAGRLAIIDRRSTIKTRDVQSAVRLVLSGALQTHAVSAGTRAVTRLENHEEE